jgi:hypothetical protein
MHIASSVLMLKSGSRQFSFEEIVAVATEFSARHAERILHGEGLRTAHGADIGYAHRVELHYAHINLSCAIA